MATTGPAGEPSKNFKECLEESCKAYEKRKKERAEWVKGDNSGQEVDIGDKKVESTPKNGIDKLIEDVSFHARGLRGCIVDIGES